MFAFGAERRCQWHPMDDKQELADEEGWQYSVFMFVAQENAWNNQCGPFSLVRRRLWKAEFPDKIVEAPRSTLLDLQCTKSQEIFRQSVGQLPLASLAEWLEADDWQTPGSYMA